MTTTRRRVDPEPARQTLKDFQHRCRSRGESRFNAAGSVSDSATRSRAPMEKLLFMVSDADIAKEVVSTLREQGLTDEDIGVLANDRTAIESLPDADMEDGSDVIPAFARGVVAGGATGLLAGVAALAFPPLGVVAGGAALVATTTLGGASFGAFTAALVGTSIDNSQLREYEEAIERGEILVIAEVPEERRTEIEKALSAAHPTLSLEGSKGAPPVL